MKLTELNGKKVCILGFGKEGKATLAAIEPYAKNITIADHNPSIQNEIRDSRFGIQAGEHWLDKLDTYDVIIASPGIPPEKYRSRISNSESRITTSTQIFFDSIADSGALTIGITGSKGKSTTSTLIYEILKAAGKDAYLIGNIGTPAIEYIDQAKEGVIFVQELSSYQLLDLKTSPHIAVITSFFPEHLDYHGSLEAYRDAKANITRYQTPDDLAFYAAGFPDAQWIASQGKGKHIAVEPGDAPISVSETQLIGQHNQSNIALAWKVCEQLGIDRDVAVKTIQTFHGLPHRLQSLGVIGGVEWIDDAISTTPESAIAAIDALDEHVETIILGGQDRGYDFTKLAQRIKNSKISTVILFPGSGTRISKALTKAGDTAQLFDAISMEEAVVFAKKHTSPNTESLFPNPVVLLSTASPSYGMFKNFEEKGEMFAKCIKHQL